MAVRVTGNYRVEGEKVKVKAYLGRDNKVIAEFPEITAKKEEIIEKLMEVIREGLAGI